ncbi:hypothetical protein SAY87_024652 [Trapa incisa]|uniref:Uncharacterized protein n=1 Tax=Trapa incisa TaxID=236973 RepID=A0AAN7GG97_9MYRT|nr:hypothetical protein SAY87_024652 [Trapa incisa]
MNRMWSVILRTVAVEYRFVIRFFRPVPKRAKKGHPIPSPSPSSFFTVKQASISFHSIAYCLRLKWETRFSLACGQNGGKPFTDEIFVEMKEGARKLLEQQEVVGSLKGYSLGEMQKLKEQVQKSYDEQLKQITDMVEAKLRETTTGFEQKLTEERAAQMRSVLSYKFPLPRV